MKDLLSQRNKAKAKKPSFRRHDSHKKKRVSANWRRPKGLQNKQRLHRKGYARGIATGYGSPKAVKGLSRNGLVQQIVSTVSQFDALDPKTDGIIIARTVGNRSRANLLQVAQSKGFTVLNIDPKQFEKRLQEAQAQKKSHKKEIVQRKKEQEKELKKAEESSDAEEKKAQDAQSPEEKKVQEKKEQDKLLTKKGESQ